MGKRKKAAKKPQGPKKNTPLATTFPCLFCNHENSVSVKMDKKAGAGQLVCKTCGQNFQTGINYLSAAVDVYAEWVDACDLVAKNAASGDRGQRGFVVDDDAEGSGGEGAAPRRGLETLGPGVSGDRNEYEDDDEELDEGGLEGVSYAGA